MGIIITGIVIDLGLRTVFRLVRLRVINLLGAFEGINLPHRLVVSNAQNARKAKREAAVMAVGTHDVVEGYFENQQRFDSAEAAEFFERVLLEEFCQLVDFCIRETGIGFADIFQLIAIFYRKV